MSRPHKIIERFHIPDKYFIVKINIWNDIIWALIVGLIITAAVNVVKIYDSNKEWEELFQLVKDIAILPLVFWFLVSSILTFIIKAVFLNNIWINIKIRRADDGIGNSVFTLLGNLLKDLDNPDNRIKQSKLRETNYFLRINNARTGRMLEFTPDNRAINLLHQVEGMISITQADPSEWLNPTYNFFLVNNYIASITKAISLSPSVRSIKFAHNRDDEKFKEFERNRKEVLKQLSELTASNSLIEFLSEKRIFVRFYILSESEIENNKSIIETLIAGHELFGCYLYFVNENFYVNTFKASPEYKTFEAFIQSISYDLRENSGRVDIAIAQSQDKLNAIYRKGDDLTLRELEYRNIILLETFLIKLSEYLHRHYEEKEFLLDKFFDEKDFVKNNEYCYLFVENDSEDGTAQ